ncbi:hypothetical protein DSO57_1038072 [Entomophthora muscae]|uniref:Uncharacterized protein n=1 Tax=Entomophthora muscae TaxID=34485 RepID=A0ACC2S0Y8_9FUNG|nr:hypothetical protein DSO57_1038072 [Entomophthora muscae]
MSLVVDVKTDFKWGLSVKGQEFPGVRLHMTFVLAVAMAALTWFGLSSFMFVGERMVYRMRKAYMKSVLQMDLACHDVLGAGEIVFRVSRDMEVVRECVSEKLGLLTMDFGVIFFAVISSFSLYIVDVALIFLILAMALVVAVVGNRRAGQLEEQALAEQTAAENLMRDAVADIRAVHSFSMLKKVAVHFERLTLQSEKFSLKRVVVESITGAMVILSVNLGFAVFIGIELHLPKEVSSNYTHLVFVALCLFLFLRSILRIPQSFNSIRSARVAAAKVLQVIELRPGTFSGEKMRFELASIAFHSVDFQLLNRVTLKVPAGAHVAIVGTRDSGKSTVIQLIERFHDPTCGMITVGGINIKEFNVSWLRRQIGYIPQEPVVFSDTFHNNIAMGFVASDLSPKKQRELVEKVCVDLGMHDFVCKLPQGYETPVGDKGMSLSSDMKQRISVARAIVKDPTILLLDQATLDPASERALDRIAQGRTVITVAHRLSTVQHATSIVVMDRGRIVEQGTHDQLIANGRMYPELLRIQNLIPPLSTKVPSVIPSSPTETVFSDTRASLFESMWYLLGLGFPENYYNLAGAVGAILGGMNKFILVVWLSPQYNEIQRLKAEEESDASNVTDMLLTAVSIAVLAAMVHFFWLWGFGIGAGKLLTRLRLLLLGSILKQEMAWFQINSTEALVAMASCIPRSIDTFKRSALGPLLRILADLVSSAALTFYFIPHLAEIILVFFLALLVLGYASMALFDKSARQRSEAYQKVNDFVQENISQIRTVLSLAREDIIFTRYCEHQRAALRTGYLNSCLTALFISIPDSILPLIIVAVGFFIREHSASLAEEGDENRIFYLGSALIFTMAAIEAAKEIPALPASNPLPPAA